MMIKNSFLKETFLNYVYKIFLMGIGFLSIPLLIKYLGNEKYGVWVTILAVISWAQMSDFGIGNGLRNRITENLSLGKEKNVKSYITTGYISLSLIAIVIFFMGTILINFLNLQKIFNVNILEKELKISVIITLFSFSLNFVLGLGKTIANSIHKSSLVSLSQTIYSIILITSIVILENFFNINRSLINISIIYLISTSLANIILTSIIFQKQYLVPKQCFFNRKYLKDIFGVGIKFFLIQICGIILFSTDSMIITNILGPIEVTKYSLIDKLFNTITNLHSILLIALWSGVSQAYIKKDYNWIKKILKKLKLTLLPLLLSVVVLSVFINKIVYIWTREVYNFDPELVVVFSLYTVLIAWTGINLNIVNGAGKLNLQLILYILAAILNIPLSIYFAKYLMLGIMGVKLATLICLLPIGIIIPYQVRNILSEGE